jgi:hypothetical protein
MAISTWAGLAPRDDFLADRPAYVGTGEQSIITAGRLFYRNGLSFPVGGDYVLCYSDDGGKTFIEQSKAKLSVFSVSLLHIEAAPIQRCVVTMTTWL